MATLCIQDWRITVDCPFHYDHENRIKNLEVTMKELNGKIKEPTSPLIWAALISLCGTAGTIVGQLVIAYVT